MTTAEAVRVAEAVAPVDGYCSVCVGGACARLSTMLPEHDWPRLIAEASGGEISLDAMRAYAKGEKP